MGDPLSMVTGLVAVALAVGKVSSLCYTYGKAVQDGPSEVRALVAEVSALSGIINDILDEISSSDRTKPVSASFKSSLETCNVDLNKLHLFLIKQQDRALNRFRRFRRRAVWPLTSKETKDWLARIERWKRTFQLFFAADTARIARSSDMTLLRTEEILGDSREIKRAKEHRELLNWLSQANPRKNYEAAIAVHQEGTGKWFIESDDFKKWQTTKGSFLWVHGVPGVGKTVLSALVLQTLLKDPSRQVAYFYCDFRDSAKTNPKDIWGSLISQFILHLGEVPFGIKIAFEKRSAHYGPTWNEYKDMLSDAIEKLNGATIVIDGLDECSDGEDLEKELVNIVKASPASSVLVLSRDLIDIRRRFTGLPAKGLRIEDVEPDIRTFIRAEIERHERLACLKTPMKTEIVTIVSRGAGGMFQWARCQIDQVAQKRNDKERKLALQQLPVGLNGTYEEVLKNIPPDDKNFAIRIFTWLVGSVRPLSIDEIIEAISIEHGDQALDPDAMVNDDPYDLVDICRSLVSIDVAAGTITLSHLSVKEFLLSEYLLNLGTPASDYALQPTPVQQELAIICLTYLSFDVFAKGPCETLIASNSRYSEYKLFLYAVQNWHYHARWDNLEGQEPLIGLIDKLLLSDGQYQAWRQAFYASIGGAISKDSHLVYTSLDNYPNNQLLYASHLCLPSTVSRLLNKGLSPNYSNTEFLERVARLAFGREKAGIPPIGNPLNAAVAAGELDIMEILIANGADVNAVAGEFGTALHTAMSRYNKNDDFEPLKRILDKHNPDLNISVSGALDPPLIHLVRNMTGSDNSLLRKFLELGADPDAQFTTGSLEGCTVVSGTAVMGFPRRFQMLLKYGGGKKVPQEFVDMGFPKDASALYNFWTALTGVNMPEDVVLGILEDRRDEIVMQMDESLIAKNMIYQGIRNCIIKKTTGLLRGLLKHFGDDAGLTTTLIEEAALYGNLEIVELMLEVCTEDGAAWIGQSLYLAATMYGAPHLTGHCDIVTTLVEYGVPVDAPDEFGWTAIMYASVYQRPEMVKFLQDLGCKLNLGAMEYKQTSNWIFETSLEALTMPETLDLRGMTASLPELQSSMAHLDQLYVHTNVPLPLQPCPFYCEFTILQVGKGVGVGICDARGKYDVKNWANISQTGTRVKCIYGSKGGSSVQLGGTDASPWREYKRFPAYSTGDIVGIAFDYNVGCAAFTLNGKPVGAVQKNAVGQFYATAYLKEGATVSLNCGDAPFLYDTSALDELLIRNGEYESDVMRAESAFFRDEVLGDNGGYQALITKFPETENPLW